MRHVRHDRQPLLLALVALVLQVTWLPAHLALECHMDVGLGHAPRDHSDHGAPHHHGPHAHTADSGHAHDETPRHGDDHRHDPHPAGDHDTEELARARESSIKSAFELASTLLLGSAASELELESPRCALSPVTEAPPPVPRGRLPGAERTRAPPSA